jgi:hypothetical protein
MNMLCFAQPHKCAPQIIFLADSEERLTGIPIGAQGIFTPAEKPP